MYNQSKSIFQLLLIVSGIILNLFLTKGVQAKTLSRGLLQPPVIIPFSGQITIDGVGEPGVIVEGLSRGTVIASTITDSRGIYSLNVNSNFCTTLEIRPRKGVFEFSPSRIFPCGGVSFSNLDFRMIRPPIIIMGGLTPFTKPQSGCPQETFEGYNYNPGACGERVYTRLLFALRTAGWEVQTVMMASSIFESTPICYDHPSALRRRINRLKAATGAHKVIILAHGLGGIVARCYIEGKNYANDVSHLFTFGSPHTGNSIEDTASIWLETLLQPNLQALAEQSDDELLARYAPDIASRIYRQVSDKVNFLCRYTLDVTVIVPFIIFDRFKSLGQWPLCETSASGMANFNLSFRPRKSVKYHLINGRNQLPSNLSLLGLRMTAEVPGPDDDLVQAYSALAFTINGPHDLLFTGDHHMSETTASRSGWYLDTNSNIDTAFASCILPMFIQRRISAPSCGRVSTEQNVFVSASSAEEEASLLTGLGIVAGEKVQQKTLLRSNLLSDTAIVISHSVQVVDPGAATFLASWVTGTINFSLVDPNGGVITPTVAGDTIQYLSEGTQASYRFSSTVPGTYAMRIQATEIPTTTDVAVNYLASLESEYVLTTARSRNWLAPGNNITITALFTGPTPIEEPSVTAFVRGSDGFSTTVLLESVGNGNFRHVYKAPNVPGYVEVEIVATGKVNGALIERNDNVAFTVYPDSFRPSGLYTETVEPFGLTIDVGISVTAGISGNLRVTGILIASDGSEVATATSYATAPTSTVQSTGIRTATTLSVPLFFNGSDLFEAGKNGPFTLRRLLVIDERDNTLVSADETNVFVTSAIEVDRFANLLFLPLATK